MEKFIITKPNGWQIPCLAEIPAQCTGIVLSVHGMNSDKACPIAMALMATMPRHGLGVISYDQPGHGSQEAQDEEMTVTSCLNSLAAVEAYARDHYPSARICYFGSSFGAYILGVYLAKYPHAGHAAFMRSAGVILPQMLVGDVHADPDPAAMEVLNRQGYIETLVAGRPVRFTKTFLEELRANSMIDMYRETPPADVSLAFVHGQEDAVVPVAAIQAFAAAHAYPLTVIPGEGHSINSTPEAVDRVLELAYKHFTKE
jgi:alpha-beta hydrolase superfamily lysophospholipase